MNNSVDIELEFDDDSTIIEPIKDFFAPLATVHVNKAERKAIKSWDRAVEIVLTIVGTWITERFVLDPLADKAAEWRKDITSFWKESGFQRRVNVIVKFQQGEDKFEIQLIGAHEPDVVGNVWQIAKDVIEFVETQNISLEKIRITSNTDQGLLIIGYSGSRPKYIINLKEKVILPIKTSSGTDESNFDPEIEIWVISLLQRRLEYLKFIKQTGIDVPESEIANLEAEIQRKIEMLS